MTPLPPVRLRGCPTEPTLASGGGGARGRVWIPPSAPTTRQARQAQSTPPHGNGGQLRGSPVTPPWQWQSGHRTASAQWSTGWQ
eukprot:13926817-Heterocapsa_arctica.AAC.1